METSVADWMIAIGTLAGGLGAIGLLAVTSAGLEFTKREFDAWKRQLHGTDKYQVTKSIIRALNDVQDFIRWYEIHTEFAPQIDEQRLAENYKKAYGELKSATVDATLLWGTEWKSRTLGYLTTRLIGMSMDSSDSVLTDEERKQSVQESLEWIESLVESLRADVLGENDNHLA